MHDHHSDKGAATAPSRTEGLFVLFRLLLFPEFKKHRLRLLIGFTALISVDFCQLVIPRILKHGVDSLAEGRATQQLLFTLGALIIAIAVGVVILRFFWRTLIIGFSRRLERSLRNRIFNHIIIMDQAFFEKRSTGDIMAHASNDLAAVQMACGMGMIATVDALVLSIAAIGFMIHIHPFLTLAALLPMPILAVSTRFLSGRLHHRFNTVQELFSLLTEFARSTLVSVRLSKAYTLEDIQTKEFDTLGKRYIKENIRVAMIQGLLFPAATLIGNLGLLAILYFGGTLAIRKAITMGDFVAFITYLQMLIWPMMAVGWVTNLMQRGSTALRRIHALVSSKPLLRDAPPSGLVTQERPFISVRDLSFTYPSSRQPRLQHFSFEAGPGILGIAGRTGSGKTTLCRLLLRLYPVADQTIFLDSRDVNHLSLDEVRSRIAYVGQEPFLFSDSIRTNIAFGKKDAGIEEIEQAARDSGVHEEIVSFPKGYETIIGERGITLSGGQRQRIALARALLCDRPILLIDDGLSAVDTATESRILTILHRSQAGKTVLIVSNRVKVLSLTDRILLIDRGRLILDGPHEELLHKSDFYRTMYAKQMQSDEGR